MSIQINVREFSDAQVQFSYSVLHELLISLHVLEDYRAYPLHLNWSLKTLRTQPQALKDERQYFHMLLSTLVFCLLDVDWMTNATFTDELRTFAEQPLDAFTKPILSRLLLAQPPGGKTVLDKQYTVEQLLHDPFLQEKAREWIKTYFPSNEPFFDDLLHQPQTVKDRFIHLIEGYWEHIFADFWQDNERHFLQDIADKGQRLLKSGVLKMLASISPKMNILRNLDIVTYLTAGAEDNFVLNEGDTLTLHPSYFTYPMLAFSLHNTKGKLMRLSITYPLSTIYSVNSSPVLPDELLKILTAISDPTRLKILRLVAQYSRSTREIAQILNLSESAVSKHLQVLRNGGWVTSERNSYYVMYSATKKPLSVLNRGVEDIFYK